MSGHEFQVGDRVRYGDEAIRGVSFNSLKRGLEGTVVKFRYDGQVIVDFSPHNFNSAPCYPENLSLVFSDKEPEMTIPDYLFQRDEDI